MMINKVSVDFQKYVLTKNILNNILILDTSIKTIKKTSN
jgi:hypothetical protein